MSREKETLFKFGKIQYGVHKKNVDNDYLMVVGIKKRATALDPRQKRTLTKYKC